MEPGNISEIGQQVIEGAQHSPDILPLSAIKKEDKHEGYRQAYVGAAARDEDELRIRAGQTASEQRGEMLRDVNERIDTATEKQQHIDAKLGAMIELQSFANNNEEGFKREMTLEGATFQGMDKDLAMQLLGFYRNYLTKVESMSPEQMSSRARELIAAKQERQ